MVTEQLCFNEKFFVASSIIYGCGHLLCGYLLLFILIIMWLSIMNRSAERCALQLYQTSLKTFSRAFWLLPIDYSLYEKAIL